MRCREFKSKHVGFVDDNLSAVDMAAMRRHTHECQACATLDVRIRRSLLVMRNLPPIEPSADFFARLTRALEAAPPPPVRRPMTSSVTTVAAVTAALAAAVYFAMTFGVSPRQGKDGAPVVSTVATAPIGLNGSPLENQSIPVALASAVPTGIPVWPAMFMVGELPTQMANGELLETGYTR